MQGSTAIAVMGASGRMGQMLIKMINEHHDAHLVAVTERPGHDWVGRDLGEAMGGAATGVPVFDEAIDAMSSRTPRHSCFRWSPRNCNHVCVGGCSRRPPGRTPQSTAHNKVVPYGGPKNKNQFRIRPRFRRNQALWAKNTDADGFGICSPLVFDRSAEQIGRKPICPNLIGTGSSLIYQISYLFLNRNQSRIGPRRRQNHKAWPEIWTRTGTDPGLVPRFRPYHLAWPSLCRWGNPFSSAFLGMRPNMD